MSESDSTRLTPRQARVVKLSTAVIACVLVVLIVAVGELFILRASSHAQVRQLACYMVRYAPDTDQTAKDIRGAYDCPPARALPSARTRSTGPASAPTAPSAARTPATPGPALDPASVGPAAGVSTPQRSAPAKVARPVPSPSASTSTPPGILGGLLCDPAGLGMCVR